MEVHGEGWRRTHDEEDRSKCVGMREEMKQATKHRLLSMHITQLIEGAHNTRTEE